MYPYHAPASLGATVNTLIQSLSIRTNRTPMSHLDAVVTLQLLECFKFLMKDSYGMEKVSERALLKTRAIHPAKWYFCVHY